jgi:hypothetical protein
VPRVIQSKVGNVYTPDTRASLGSQRPHPSSRIILSYNVFAKAIPPTGKKEDDDE